MTGPDCHRTSQQQLSWGSLPFSDISSGGPVHSGLPRPTPSDSRVSHPLAGLRPPKPSGLVSCRYRSWGSPTGPFPLAEPSFLSKPVTFVTLNRTQSTSSELEELEPILDFKALLTARIRHPSKRGEPLRKAAALLAFGPLRESPSRRPDARAPDPLMSFTSPLAPESVRKHAALQGFDLREVGLSLARLPPFLAFLHLLSRPQI